MRALEIAFAANKTKLEDIETDLRALSTRFDNQDTVLKRIDKAVARLSLIVPVLGGAAFIIGLLIGRI